MSNIWVIKLHTLYQFYTSMGISEAQMNCLSPVCGCSTAEALLNLDPMYLSQMTTMSQNTEEDKKA